MHSASPIVPIFSQFAVRVLGLATMERRSSRLLEDAARAWLSFCQRGGAGGGGSGDERMSKLPLPHLDSLDVVAKDAAAGEGGAGHTVAVVEAGARLYRASAQGRELVEG